MEIALTLVLIYFVAGFCFAAAFVIRGVSRIDAAAEGTGWGFRLVIFPGCVVLWPLMAWRWKAGAGHPPAEANAHRQRARAHPAAQP